MKTGCEKNGHYRPNCDHSFPADLEDRVNEIVRDLNEANARIQMLNDDHGRLLVELMEQRVRVAEAELRLSATVESLRRANQQCSELRAEHERLKAGGNVNAG